MAAPLAENRADGVVVLELRPCDALLLWMRVDGGLRVQGRRARGKRAVESRS